MKITKETLRQLIKEEIEEARELVFTKKVGPAFGGEETASGPSDTGHVYVLYRTKGDKDPVLWGIYSSKENVEKWIENESEAAAKLGVEFNKGDYSYGKQGIDLFDHPGVDKGK